MEIFVCLLFACGVLWYALREPAQMPSKSRSEPILGGSLKQQNEKINDTVSATLAASEEEK